MQVFSCTFTLILAPISSPITYARACDPASKGEIRVERSAEIPGEIISALGVPITWRSLPRAALYLSLSRQSQDGRKEHSSRIIIEPRFSVLSLSLLLSRSIKSQARFDVTVRARDYLGRPAHPDLF